MTPEGSEEWGKNEAELRGAHGQTRPQLVSPAQDTKHPSRSAWILRGIEPIRLKSDSNLLARLSQSGAVIDCRLDDAWQNQVKIKAIILQSLPNQINERQLCQITQGRAYTLILTHWPRENESLNGNQRLSTMLETPSSFKGNASTQTTQVPTQSRSQQLLPWFDCSHRHSLERAALQQLASE